MQNRALRGCLIALCFLAAFPAVSQQTRWHPPEKFPEQSQDTNQKQPPSEPDKRGTPETPLVVKTVLPEKSPEESANDARERNDKRWYDSATLIIAISTLIILAVQAGVFWVQADRLKQTIRKMDEIASGQTEDMAETIRQSSRSATAIEVVASGISKTVTKSEQIFDIQKTFWDEQIDVFSAISERSKYITAAIVVGVAIAGGTAFVVYTQSQQTNKLIEIYNRLADATEDAKRAWIGPSGVTMEVPSIDHPIKAIVMYTNSGKEAAAINDGITFTIFSKEEWINGVAARELDEFKNKCIAIQSVIATRTSFPTTGFGAYTFTIDTGSPASTLKYIADQKLIDGDSIFAIRGCFVYFTTHKVRHTAFCGFYQAKVTTLPNLNICTVGGKSD